MIVEEWGQALWMRVERILAKQVDLDTQMNAQREAVQRLHDRLQDCSARAKASKLDDEEEIREAFSFILTQVKALRARVETIVRESEANTVEQATQLADLINKLTIQKSMIQKILGSTPAQSRETAPHVPETEPEQDPSAHDWYEVSSSDK